MKLELYSRKLEDTHVMARAFACLLTPGDVVGFSGDLGAGKTTFIKEIAQYFGIDKDQVTSTSFVLAREYEGQFPILHADVYRLDCIDELPIEISEFIADKQGILLMEWIENIKMNIDFCISLRQERLNERLIEITGPPERIKVLEPALQKYIIRL